MSNRRNDKGDKDDKSKDNDKEGENTNQPSKQKSVAKKLPPLYIPDEGCYRPDPLGLHTILTPRQQQLLAGGRLRTLQPWERWPLVLNPQHPDTVRPKKDRAYFEARDSCKQPADGPTSKPMKKKCLTCIEQGGACHGTDVTDGRCLSCQGVSVKPGKSRRSRKCFWRDESEGIYTYEDAQNAHKSMRIPRNTRPVAPRRPPRDAAQPNLAHTRPGFFDLEPEDGELVTLRALVATLWDTNQFSTNPEQNLAAIQEAATLSLRSLQERLTEQDFAGNYLPGHYRTIIDLATTMMQRDEPDEVLSVLGLMYLLPDDHPGRYYRRPGESRKRTS